MNRFLALQFLALLAFGLGGCTESLSDPMPDQAPTPVVQQVSAAPPEAVYDSATGLWLAHRSDPYTLENFRQAYDNLLSGSARSRSAVSADELAEIDLQATHYSVRIYPKSEQEQWQLEHTEGVTIAYVPFDYVQLPESETSGMDSSSSAVIPDARRYTVTYDLESVEGFKKTETLTLPVLYAVWPCDKPFPADMDYEIQYEVFLPEYPSASARSATPASEALRMLEQEALTLALGAPSAMTRSPITVLPPITNPTTKTISGSFKYYDDLLEEYVPLQNLLVRMGLGANIMEAYTDANGAYSFTFNAWTSTIMTSISTVFSNTKWKITDPGSSSPITITWGNINDTDLNITIKKSAGNEYNIHRAVNFYFNGEHEIPKMVYTYGCKIVANHNVIAGTKGLFVCSNKNTAYIEIFNNESFDPVRIGTVGHELGHYTQYCRLGGTSNFRNIAQFLKESYASYVGWSICEAYYISIGWVRPTSWVDISDQAREYWPCFEEVLDYTPLFIDLVDDYNQPIYNGAETVDDQICKVPAAVIERIALEANDWAVCRSILWEYADKYYTYYPPLPPGVIGVINPVRRMYYSTSQLSKMLLKYDRIFFY